MKKITLIFLLLPFLSLAQKTDTTLFNGAKKIIVKTNVPTSQGLKLITEALINNDFSIDVANVELGILRTNPKNVGTFGVQIIDVLVKDNEVILSSRARTTIADVENKNGNDLKDFQTVPYRDKNLIKKIFSSMEIVAKSLKSPVVYSN